MSVLIQRKDELASPIKLSETAKNHILRYLEKKEANGIRLSIKKAGCSGYTYVIDYVKEASTDDLVIPLTNDYSLYIDAKSYPYLKNLEIDYVQQGLNHKFVFHNPNQTGQCGCGESFTIE